MKARGGPFKGLNEIPQKFENPVPVLNNPDLDKLLLFEKLNEKLS
jgi:hypothetical protein